MSEAHPPLSAVAVHFEEEIAALAHHYYEEEGRPEGRADAHWHRAEEEIRLRDARPSAEFPPEGETSDR